MITFGQGNLLAAQADALVNTVNTVGVMGKGVALQFKQAFPENFKAYERACKSGDMRMGRMFVTYTGMLQPRLIVNFPTKKHWRGNSRIEDIKAGLKDLVRVVQSEDVRSIAMPPLGCGLGGLRWEDVRPLIEEAFASLPNVEVILFAPGQPIAPEARIVRTAKPDMNQWRAALIKIVDAYSVLGFEATHLEAQKLLYFLARIGEPVRVKFIKGSYGPYDEGMKHALQRLEGHYIDGFGEGGRLESVRLAPNALEEAEQFLASSQEQDATTARIERVVDLIDGYETPYGLELLATVHWVVTEEGAASEDQAVHLAQSWSKRKAKALRAEHLRQAFRRLSEQGWFAEASRTPAQSPSF